MCYKIKPEIIDELMKHNCNINSKNISLTTPLYYAIETLHPDLVKKLLDFNATPHSSTVKNNSSITPLQHALNLYLTHTSYIYNHNTNDNNNFTILQRLCQPVYKEIKKFLQNKPEYGNNIIKYFIFSIFSFNSRILFKLSKYIFSSSLLISFL